MIYKASLDGNAIIVTIGILVILTMITCTCIYLVVNSLTKSRGTFLYMLFLHGFFVSVMVFFAAVMCRSMPENYILDNNRLVIHRLSGDVSVPLSEIIEIRRLSNDEIPQKKGSEGFFGYIGSYTDSKAGTVHIYTTREKNWIIIVTRNNGAITISPDNMGLYNDILWKTGNKQ